MNLIRIPVTQENYQYNYFNIVVEPEFKMTIVMIEEQFKYFESTGYFTGRSSLTLLDETYGYFYIGIPFNRFKPVFEEINEKTHQALAAGIFPKFLYGTGFRYLIQKIAEEIPVLVLTMDHLSIGFLVCLIPLAMSLVAFAFELFSSKIVKVFQNYATFLAVIRALSQLKLF